MSRRTTPIRTALAATAVLALTMLGPPASQASPSSAATPPVDGRIAFAGDCQLFTINPDGTALQQITHFRARCAAAPAWSPDGSRIAAQVYSADFSSSAIYTMNADGSDTQLVINEGSGIYEGVPDYTPDGSRIVYARLRTDPTQGSAIYTVGVDGTGASPLTRYGSGVHAGVDTRPQVSPDGSWLTFNRFGWHGIQSQVWLMPMDASTSPVPITPARLAARSAKWAPNSRSVDAASLTGLGGHIIKATVAAPLRRTQLTFTPWPNQDFSPAISPSGSDVAFVSDRRYPDGCCNELFTMRADGTDQHFVAGEVSVSTPDWGTAPLLSLPSQPLGPAVPSMRARAERAEMLESAFTTPGPVGCVSAGRATSRGAAPAARC